MKIDEYYRYVARISLNGSILALIPAILIIAGNLLYFQHSQIMLLTIPFFIYSIVNFQFSLRRVRQALMIERHMVESDHVYQSIFNTGHLVILYCNTLSPRLMLYFPDGYLSGVIKKYWADEKEFGGSVRNFALYDFNEEIIGFYEVQIENQLKINVYDKSKNYIGCFERTKLTALKKAKKELLNAEGRFIAAVEGASLYMDEQVNDSYNRQVGRLRRGWMPLEWSSRFPEANTPVFTLANGLSDKEKLLQMSFLINEFFLER